MARTSSLNCLSCKNPYQTPDSLTCLPLFTENPFFSLKSASSDLKELRRMIFSQENLGLAAQKSHRKIAVTTVAASGLATIPLQKSQGFSLRWPQKKIASRWRCWGLGSQSQEARSDHGCKSPQPRDFAAAVTMGH